MRNILKARIEFSEIPKGLMSVMTSTEAYLGKTGFDIKLVELIRMRVSGINACAYCIDMHFKEAVAAGEDMQRLYSVSAWKETTYYSDEERACLAGLNTSRYPLVAMMNKIFLISC